VRFFFNNKNAIQGREQEAFRVMHPHFVASAKACRQQIQDRLGSGMNTSMTKVIDNAIVGHGCLRLKIKED
jgi:hypothetical protein